MINANVRSEIERRVNDYDSRWFIDHDTTVQRWDDEVAAVLEIGVMTALPTDVASAVPVVLHHIIHETLEQQDRQEHDCGDPERRLFQFIALRSLFEVVALADPGIKTRDPDCIWVRSESCVNTIGAIRDLMIKKNRQYGSAWSVLRSSDMGGTIHAKIHRISRLVDGEENTFESMDDNWRDIFNYAIFSIIRLGM